jgi:hypothetical protein
VISSASESQAQRPLEGFVELVCGSVLIVASLFEDLESGEDVDGEAACAHAVRVWLDPRFKVGDGKGRGHEQHSHDEVLGCRSSVRGREGCCLEHKLTQVRQHATEDGQGGRGLLVEPVEDDAGLPLEVFERPLGRDRHDG